ncbi:MAG: hypothetical protein AMS19_11150 [Gemmatimonas sp. SG8_23]|nr:MAG: hypothetical protein AMS19_11150 [Gemmatimonas sp. SG8_23]
MQSLSLRAVAFWLSILMIFMIPWEAALVVSSVGSISRLIGAAAGGFWLLTVVVAGRIRRPSGFHVAAAAFFLWCAVTQFWTIDPDLTLERSLAYLRMAALTILIWDLYRTPAQINLGLQAYVLGTLVPIGSTIFNYLSGVQSVWGRYSATGDNANTTGIVIALGMPLAMGLAGHGSSPTGRRWILQLLNYGIVAVGLFAIGLTATRFAAIMTLPAFLLALSAWPRIKPGSRMLLALVLVGALLLIPRLLPEHSVQRLGNAVEDATEGDLTGRTVIWKYALETWFEHPIAGVGSGAFRRAVEPIFGREVAAHNSFLAVLAETGLVGLLLLGLVLSVSLSQAAGRSRLEARFWLTILIVLGLGNLAMTFIYVKSTWLLLSLNAAGASVPDPSAVRSQPAGEPAAA